MPAIILSDNGATSGSAGLKTSGGNDGVLQLQTTTSGGTPTTAISISNTQVVTYTNQPTYTGGTANGVLYLNGSKAVTSGTALVFDGSNLGLGVTPSAWNSDYRALDVSTYGNFYGRVATSNVGVVLNAYRNSGGSWIYKTTNAAARYEQDSGFHIWYNAASGTAGNAITFTQAMTLDANGKLLIGTTSASATETLRVYNASNARVLIDQASNGLVLGADGSGPFFDTSGSNRLGFFVGGTQRMTLDTSGNLGVGTTSPATRLDVSNPVVGITYPLFLTNTSATNNGRGVGMKFTNGSGSIGEILGYYDGTDQTLIFTSTGSTRFNAGGAERMRITSGGTIIVGAGTTSSTDTMLLYPASGDALLNLKGPGAYMGLNSIAGGYSAITGYDNGTVRWSVGQFARGGSDGASIYYGSSYTEAARFASNIEMYRPVLLRQGLADTYSGSLGGTYNSGTWYELANSGNLGSGIFVLQLYVDTYLTGSVYYMIYASVPFFMYNVGSNSGATFTLPTMYGTGHANNGIDAPPIRLRLTGGGAGIFVDIQPNQTWTGLNGTGGRNVNFNFKRIG